MDRVAADWAVTMAANGSMAHNPDYASQIPGGWTAAGENVAQGHPTGAAMHTGWMGSSGHRANILGNYTDIGIAFLSAGGTTWGVQVFARYPGHSDPAAPAPPPAPAPSSEPPAPAETTSAPTATPNATPTATATPSAAPTSSPSPRGAASASPGADPPGAGAGWMPGVVVVAVLATTAAVVVTVVRRRRRTER